MVATSSLGGRVLQGYLWQMQEDGRIKQTLRDYQLGGTPIFAEAVAEHNRNVLDESA